MLIGLTGNIATGKSEVARMLAELGARVIDADQVAHEVMRPGGPAYGAVVEAFGPEILAPDGTIDRAKLGAIVFRDARRPAAPGGRRPSGDHRRGGPAHCRRRQSPSSWWRPSSSSRRACTATTTPCGW